MRRHTAAIKSKDSNLYTPIPGSDSYHQSENEDVRFTKQAASDTPWRAIALAVFLFVVGSALLLLGSFIMTGHIDSRYEDRMWPLLLFGILMFIPGAYYTHTACRAFFGHYGYSLDDIPQFE